jgi:hypothetical protein
VPSLVFRDARRYVRNLALTYARDSEQSGCRRLIQRERGHQGRWPALVVQAAARCDRCRDRLWAVATCEHAAQPGSVLCLVLCQPPCC